jgi:hypothetical protein
MIGSIDETKLLTQLHSWCRRAFEQGADGKALASRMGLGIAHFADRMRLGYADMSLLGAVPDDGMVRDALVDLGVLSFDGALTITDNLIVPVFDRKRTLVGFVAVDEHGAQKRFPASLSTFQLEPTSLRDKPVVVVDHILQALHYQQIGIPCVVPLVGTPGQTEEQCLKFERPQRAYCDTASPDAVRFLQGMEIPCFQLKMKWPATLSQVHAAMTAAQPIEVGLGEDAVVRIMNDSLSMIRASREYELRDLEPASVDRLRVRLKALKDGTFHLDTVDLYAARSRAGYAKAAAELFNAAKSEVETDLCLLISKLEAIRAAQQTRAKPNEGYVMTSDEEVEATEFLKSPNLLDRIVLDMERLGYVGEDANKRLGYLISISRKLDSPLSSAILSRASAGKSSLMDALADMCPPEDLVRFTRVTPQALYYSARKGLRHKLVQCAEIEGLTGSDYMIREMISAKKLRLILPVSDGETGMLRATEYEVEGPIALMFSTTRPAIHFENATRCFAMSLDESAEQTKSILEEQRRRRTMARIAERPVQEDLRRLHRNVQRLLKPLAVVNPYAPYLEFPTKRLEMRREQEKYLTLIDSVVLLYQHQRQIKTAEVEGRQVEYVEVTIEDIEQANKLMSQVLGTASEELSGPARKLLGLIQSLVEERAQAAGIAPAAVHFLRRDIREYTGWSDSQIKAHIRQLEDLEYVRVSRGERGRTYRYELAAGPGRGLPGLVDGAALREVVRKSGVVGHGLVPAAQPNFAEAATQSQVESLKVGQPVKTADPIKSSEVEVHA